MREGEKKKAGLGHWDQFVKCTKCKAEVFDIFP